MRFWGKDYRGKLQRSGSDGAAAPARLLLPRPLITAILLGVLLHFLLVASAVAVDWSVADCTSCHTTYPDAHSLENCFSCHAQYSVFLDPGDGHYWTIDRPAGSCVNGGGCHQSGGVTAGYVHGSNNAEPGDFYQYAPESPISFYSDTPSFWFDTLLGVNRTYPCTFCHSAAYPHIYRHDEAALEAAHLSEIAGTTCERCHTNQLSDEPGHATCATCHASTDPLVTAAISAGDTSCDACHDYDHIALHDGALTAPDCLTCHDSNASTEHEDDCALCHESADPVVIAAIDAGDVSCEACHDIGAAHVALHDSADVNASCIGSGCHAANLVTEHDGECAPCHNTTTWYVVEAVADGNLSCTACHRFFHYKGSSPYPYMSWEDAELSMQLRGVYSGGSPHGGYTAHTTKCAVCHAAHRAATDQTEAGVGSYWKLTQGGNSCTACHTASGANPSAKLVEWPSAYVDGGPHQSFNCMGQCHAGVHGAIVSEYDTAARFLLNPNRRPEANTGVGLDDGLAAAIEAGNVNPAVNDATLRNGAPTKATRAMVTGYLCAQAGCHTHSQFAINAKGYAEMRVSVPEDPYGPYDMAFTGHTTGGAATHCYTGGCHAVPNEIDDSNCATCHDFVGRVTGTTAWPHANRGIEVYEWVRDTDGVLGTRLAEVTGNNLWMYTGDVTFRDADGEPVDEVMWDGKSGPGITHGSRVQGFAPNRINTRTVLEGNASPDDGKPGNIQDGVCLKCHGYKYWPYHGQGSLGNPASSQFERNFANY